MELRHLAADITESNIEKDDISKIHSTHSTFRGIDMKDMCEWDRKNR